MKIRWLVILFIFFLGVIFLSLSIVQQSQNIVPLADKQILNSGQLISSSLPVYSLPTTSTAAVVAPLGKSGITIIKAPAVEPAAKSSTTSRVEDKTASNFVGQNVASSAANKNSIPAGITKIGKRPDSKKVAEMNSSGVVMY